MFKKTQKNKKIRKNIFEDIIDEEIKEDHEAKDKKLKKFKQIVKKDKKGIRIKDIILPPPKTEEEILYEDDDKLDNDDIFKKTFISESKIKSRLNKFLGKKKESNEKTKDNKLKGINKLQKEIYSLPENLKTNSVINLNYGLGVYSQPIKGQEKKIKKQIKIEEIKNKEDTKKQFELNYDSVHQYDNFKDDFCKLDKSFADIAKNFGNVFLNQTGRKMKFIKEKEKLENQLNEIHVQMK